MATCQAAAQGWSGMMALRFFLAVFEAGFGPGVPFLMSFFYRRNELGLRCGLFLSAAPLANTFAGALAYGITSGHPLLTSWRLLFLVEGVPTFIGAVVAFLFMPNSVSSTTFLTEEEKQVALVRSMRHGGREEETERGTGISLRDMGRTFLDAKCWFTAVCPLLLLDHENGNELTRNSSCTSAATSASLRFPSSSLLSWKTWASHPSTRRVSRPLRTS